MKAIEELLRGAVADGLCVGGAAAVGVGEKTLGTCVGGLVRVGGVPLDSHTRFDLDALTALLVPVTLTLLALERGMLSLGDTLGMLLDAPADKRAVTVQQLLTGTSGFPASLLLEQEATDADDALRAILKHPLQKTIKPGKARVDAIVLGKVLERVYGLPLDEAAKRLVFTPLGMRRTGYLPSGDNIAAAERDAETGELLSCVARDENARFQHGVSGHAGVFADCADCARFASMLACNGLVGGAPFLTPSAVALLSRDHTPKKAAAVGLGVTLAKRGSTFMGDLWARDGFGVADDAGASIAVEPQSGLWVVLLLNRACNPRDAERLASLRRRVHNRAKGLLPSAISRA